MRPLLVRKARVEVRAARVELAVAADALRTTEARSLSLANYLRAADPTARCSGCMLAHLGSFRRAIGEARAGVTAQHVDQLERLQVLAHALRHAEHRHDRLSARARAASQRDRRARLEAGTGVAFKLGE